MRIENPLLLAEMRLPGCCEMCGKVCRVREPAHIFARGMGGGGLDVRINLLSLGSTLLFMCACHTKAHNRPSQKAMLAVAARRERTTPEAICQVMWILRRLPKNPTVAEIEAEMMGLAAPEAGLLNRTLHERYFSREVVLCR